MKVRREKHEADKTQARKWKATRAILKHRDKAVLNKFTAENTGQPPLCNWCKAAVLSVRHMLITCPRLGRCKNEIL